MPSPSQSPIDRTPAPFDRGALRRSVIAIPLREAIKSELSTTKQLEERYAEYLGTNDTGIFYRADETLTHDEAAARIRLMLDEALREVGDRPGQVVGPPQSTGTQLVSLGHLDGRVIEELLSIDQASARPILDRIWPTRYEVIIDINLNFKPPDPATPTPPQGSRARAVENELDVRQTAQAWIKEYVERAKAAARTSDPDQGVDERKTRLSPQYVFARLEGKVIEALVAIDQLAAGQWAAAEAEVAAARTRAALGAEEAAKRLGTREEQITRLEGRFRAIHSIWPDFRLRSCITRSISTVKADAAHRSFTALGEKITWAVVDSGIDAGHPHFRLHKNIDPASPYHADFTGGPGAGPGSALKDAHGHGTHVAGIIAGEQSVARESKREEMVAVWREIDERVAADGQSTTAELKRAQLDAISGMAPKCELVSLKVLDRFGQGTASNVIAALAHVQAINHYGRELHIHGINLSLGYPFDPKWFACGHSPLCVEVNRLVKSGVVVVIAAGNSGYGTLMTKEGQSDASLDLTINDPGNAEYAITVGSTHREEPHRYGVSYFSSKGPTGDGRYKPDLLAPGERIVSCAAAKSRLVSEETENSDEPCSYFETSGTSMAAPHVSGAIAAFLSIRREFIGEPERVKQIFCSTATDLGRDRYFQGSGLVDLMRAIQSV